MLKSILPLSCAMAFAATTAYADEPMTVDDLVGLESSISSVMDAIGKKYGKTPDGFCINTDTADDAYKFPSGQTVCTNYGWTCYLATGTPVYSDGGVSPMGTSVVANVTHENTTSDPLPVTFTAKETIKSETTASASITTGLSYEQSFGLEGVFSSKVSFNLSATVSKGGSQSTEVGFSDALTVNVPPNSKMTITWQGTLTESTLHYSIPIGVTSSCSVAANYGERIAGHYFHRVSAADALKKQHGFITGELSNSTILDIEVIVGKPVPLDG